MRRLLLALPFLVASAELHAQAEDNVVAACGLQARWLANSYRADGYKDEALAGEE